MRPPLSRSVSIQGALTVVALAVVALAPAARGPMLLVPIVTDQPTAIRIAVANGARLLGPARAGTVLVWADARAVRPLAAAGVLALAAPFAACGKTPA